LPLLFILLRKMSSNPIKAVNFLWKQNIRTPKEISSKTGVPLRTCQRYVALLKKSDRPRKRNDRQEQPLYDHHRNEDYFGRKVPRSRS